MFTYDPTTDLGKLREKIGDTDLERHVFEDEELSNILVQTDFNLSAAAAEAYRRLMMRPYDLKRKFGASNLEEYPRWGDQLRTLIEQLEEEARAERLDAYNEATTRNRTFTYDRTAEPALTALRDKIGDNESTRVLFGDEELKAILSDAEGNTSAAAAEALRRLIARPADLARMFQESSLERYEEWVRQVQELIASYLDHIVHVDDVTWERDLSDAYDEIVNRQY